MIDISEEWLKGINEKFRAQGIPPKARPMLAMSEFSKEFKCNFLVTPEISEQVGQWFKQNTKPGSLAIGSMYQGAYYFDACFWPVTINIIFGSVHVQVFNSLTSMPHSLQEQVSSSRIDMLNLTCLWLDCLDYAYGYDDILKVVPLSDLALNFVKSAHKELQATVSLLLQDSPEPKAIETARMATEMFLKSILILQNSWTDEKPLKKIGHNLQDAMSQCINLTGSEDLKAIQGDLNFFPPIHDRYNARDWSGKELWHAYCLAQNIGAIFARMFSERNSRDEFFRKLSLVGNN